MNGRRKVHVKKRMKVEGGEEENTERNFHEKWDHGPCSGSMCFLLSGGMVAMVSGAVVSGASCSSTLVCDPSAADWSVPGWLWPRSAVDWSVPGWLWPRWARRIARL